MKYELVALGPCTLIGLDLGHATYNAAGQSSLDAERLWKVFMEEKIQDKIPGKTEATIFAAYHAYEGDYTGTFGYFLGYKVAPNTPVPDGLNSLQIPAQHYLKVETRGPMPDCMVNTWKEIWATDLPRAYGVDLEAYGPESSDWNDALVEIYLSTSQPTEALPPR